MYNISQAPNCLTSGSRQQSKVTLCALPIEMLSVDEGEDSAQLMIRGNQGQCQMIQFVPRGNNGKRPDFPRRKPIPGGMQHLKREVASDTHVEADLQFWELCSQGEHQCEHSKVPGACDNFMCQGHMTFIKCQGHELLFKDLETISPVLKPHQSGLINSFVIAAIPLPIGVGAPCFNYIHDSLHLTCHLL